MTAPPVLTDTSQAAPPVQLTPLMLRAAAAAAVCGCSVKHWRRLCSTGRAPSPLDLNGVSVWPCRVLHKWVDVGCPPRDQFNQEKAARPGRPARQQQIETSNDSHENHSRYAIATK